MKKLGAWAIRTILLLLCPIYFLCRAIVGLFEAVDSYAYEQLQDEPARPSLTRVPSDPAA